MELKTSSFFFQAHPFEELQLNDLPPNLILSQQWRIGARPIVSTPTIKKPVTYQSNVSIPISQSNISSTQISLQDKRKPTITDENSTNGNGNGSIASIVHTFNQPSGGLGDIGNRSSRSSSVSSTQPVVSNLIKIYSEVTATKSQRNDTNGKSTGKHDELVKIFEQASNSNQQRRATSTPPNIKQQAQIHEEVDEEIHWDNFTQGYRFSCLFFNQKIHLLVV